MDEAEMYCCSETTLELGVLAAAGSSTAPAGEALQRVEPDNNQEHMINLFSQSGLVARMEDQAASVSMMNKAMAWISSKNASFGFNFHKQLPVESSCFEQNKHFVWKRNCGRGASGEVDAFVDNKTGTRFVRKRLKVGKCLRKEEPLSLIKLNHRGVVKLFAVLCCNHTVDLLLQDAGFPLRKCLETFCMEKITGERYWEVIISLSLQLAEAVSYIHQQGICHLDIKPENLLVHQDSRKSVALVLADFGTSLSVEQMMTINMELTPEYWSPELWHQALSCILECQIDRSLPQFPPQPTFDTYAMGQCVYFMGTRRHLMLDVVEKCQTDFVIHPNDIQQVCDKFHTKPDFAVKLILMTEHSHKLPEFGTAGSWLFPGIPDALVQVIRATLNPDPDKRSTAEQVANFLRGDGQTKQTEDDLKTPTPVVDSTAHKELSKPELVHCGNTLASGVRQPCVKEAVTLRDTAPGDDKGVDDSSNLNEFNQRMALLMHNWDKNVSESVSTQQKETMVTTVPMPTSTFLIGHDDITLRPSLSALESCTTKPERVDAGHAESRQQILRLREPTLDSFGHPGSSLPECGRELADMDLKLKVPFTQQFVDPTPLDTLPFDFEKDAKEQGNEISQNMFVAGMEFGQSEKGRQASVVASKGKKDGVRGKGSKGNMKSAEKGGMASKGNTPSTISRSRSSGKQAVVIGRKKKALVSAQMSEPASEIPFVVASSSHPKPRARTMQRLPSTDPGHWPGFHPGSHEPEMEGSAEKPLVCDNIQTCSPQATFVAESGDQKGCAGLFDDRSGSFSPLLRNLTRQSGYRITPKDIGQLHDKKLCHPQGDDQFINIVSSQPVEDLNINQTFSVSSQPVEDLSMTQSFSVNSLPVEGMSMNQSFSAVGHLQPDPAGEVFELMNWIQHSELPDETEMEELVDLIENSEISARGNVPNFTALFDE